MNTAMNEVSITPTGTKEGFEDYHNDYDYEGMRVGSSSWDSNQRLHVGYLKDHKKNLYAKTPEGIAQQMQNILATRP